MLEVAELGSGFEPQLVDEQRADACARRQRVRLAPGLVEPGDQQGPEPLLIRMRLDRGLEVGEHTRVSRSLTGREQRLEQREPSRAQPDTMGDRPIPGRRERVVAELRKAGGRTLRGTFEITCIEALLRGDRIVEHRMHVDRRGIDVEPVAVARADNERTVAERLAQLRDLRLQGVPLRGRPRCRPTGPRPGARSARGSPHRPQGAPTARTSCLMARRRRLRRG